MKPIKSKLVKVRADSLAIHPYAQRELVPSKLRKLLADLDLDAIGVLHAVEYPINKDTKTWVIDGQHRLRALLEHGFGEWIVEVKIHVEVTDDARASALFLKLNDRSPVSPYDKFMNELKSGAQGACGADAVARKHGLKINRSVGDGKLVCVAALKKLYQIDQGKALGATLGTLIEAWGTKSAALEGRLIEGLGIVYARYDGSVDRPAMVKKLAKYPGSASGLIGDARGMTEYRKTTLSRCVAERVIETYNSGRRGGKLDPL